MSIEGPPQGLIVRKSHIQGGSVYGGTVNNQRKAQVTKHVKHWWTASVDGKANLVVRYGSKPLEFAKGKNAIEVGNEAEVADVLAKVCEATEHGELDALIEKQAQFGRRVTQKNK